MQRIVNIAIPGKPIPLKRPRFGKTHVYDSQADLKEDLYWEIRQQIQRLPSTYDEFTNPLVYSTFKGSVEIQYTFFMPIPKSKSKVKREALLNTPHKCKPDTDNLIKLYNDVCVALLYHDDAQIYKLSATKLYSDNPRTEMVITYGEYRV